MPTFTQIGTAVTVGSGGATDITFSSIPSTYTDLVINYSVRGTDSSANLGFILKFNSNTSGYTERTLFGNGSSASSNTPATQPGILFNYMNGSTSTSSTFSNGSIYVPNYASSSNKSVSSDSVTENNATASIVMMTAGLWSNSAAITSITLTPAAGTLVQHSTAYLYGVSNA